MCLLGKEEVVSSSLINSSRRTSATFWWHLFFVIYWFAELATSKAPPLPKEGFGEECQHNPTGASASVSSSLINSSEQNMRRQMPP